MRSVHSKFFHASNIEATCLTSSHSLNGKPTVVGGRAPSNSFNVPDTGIPSDHGALAVTPDKKKAIAEDMADAMIDNPVSGPLFHSALSTMPEEQQTIDKVSKWIANAETTTEQNDKSATEQNDKSTAWRG